ncbi:MAG: T9SS type A sorting domain-containing protein [Ignavibacteria bacterium]|nr:T9SS type A sorting domain-containing protein [Ignavibacteria bacterium]
MIRTFPAVVCLLFVCVAGAQSQPATRLTTPAGIAAAVETLRMDASVMRNPGVPERERPSASGFSAMQALMRSHLTIPGNPANSPRRLSAPGDTLVVGPGPDTLRISGAWSHAGPILVLGDGRLVFDSARAVITGNIVVWGGRAALVARHSTLVFPQEYFYQRSLIAAGGSSVLFEQTTLDYGGLPHNLAVTDSAAVEYRTVTNRGFTTCGLSGRARLRVDSCNETGEFILQDSVTLDFRNAHTVLLWPVIEAGAALDGAFPDGALVDRFTLNRNTAGTSGIRFDVNLEQCGNVLWGLMPKPGSDIRIRNSRMRAIGLWFTAPDSVAVSGLVNNLAHTQFTAPLTDRSLVLDNTFVQTWSLYSFHASVVDVKACILGEIGAFGRSRVTCANTMVDGTGGYLFASDTSTVLYGFSSATCNVRSERNGILIFAYSALTNGSAVAIGNSILICAQSGMIDDPVALEGAIAWKAEIAPPVSLHVGDFVPLPGSAWIDRGPQSVLFDFKKYAVSYQKAGETRWTLIGDTAFIEVRNAPLIQWNTAGIEPGLYNVRVTLVSDVPGAFAVDAMKSVNVLPALTGVERVPQAAAFSLYPNPARDQLVISGVTGDAAIVDALGRAVWRGTVDGHERIDASAWLPGAYLFISAHTARRIIVYR